MAGMSDYTREAVQWSLDAKWRPASPPSGSSALFRATTCASGRRELTTVLRAGPAMRGEVHGWTRGTNPG